MWITNGWQLDSSQLRDSQLKDEKVKESFLVLWIMSSREYISVQVDYFLKAEISSL